MTAQIKEHSIPSYGGVFQIMPLENHKLLSVSLIDEFLYINSLEDDSGNMDNVTKQILVVNPNTYIHDVTDPAYLKFIDSVVVNNCVLHVFEIL